MAYFAEHIGRAVYTYHNADALYRGLLVSLFVFAMFKYLRSGMSVIISCVLFIVLPLALVAFGVTNAQYFLFNPLLIGNIF